MLDYELINLNEQEFDDGRERTVLTAENMEAYRLRKRRPPFRFCEKHRAECLPNRRGYCFWGTPENWVKFGPAVLCGNCDL